MKLVIFVPGFAGSTLYAGQPDPGKVWVDVTRLSNGHLVNLKLAPDGVSPLSNKYPPITARELLSPYYDEVSLRLPGQLVGEGYQLLPWPVDWRLSVLRLGGQLGQGILDRMDNFDGFVLVGHSMGGLVCRAAWAGLRDVGRAGLVERVVTIGAPHLGTWLSAETFSGTSEFIVQLLLMVSSLLNVVTFGSRPSTDVQLVRIAAMWPALYELLPAGGISGSDPDVAAALFDAAAWPSKWGISQAWLDHAAGPYRTWLLDQSRIPPFEVLTTVAGTGIPSVSGWAQSSDIGNGQVIRHEADGDGSVTPDSALLGLSKQWSRPGRHAALCNDMVLDGSLLAMILERRSPLPPPPPPPPRQPVNVRLGPQSRILNGPPLPFTGIFGIDP